MNDKEVAAVYERNRRAICSALSYSIAQLESDVDVGDDSEGTLYELSDYRVAHEQICEGEHATHLGQLRDFSGR